MRGGFVHLDVRSYFSLKEGAFSPEALARRAAELRMPAVALADRDGLYGTARFVDACEREGVRPILGASLTVREAGTLPLPRTGRKPVDASVRAARARRGRVREPVPADHRCAHDRRARRPLAHPRADLRARGRPGRGPGSVVTAGRARDRRPARRRSTRARPVSRGLRRSRRTSASSTAWNRTLRRRSARSSVWPNGRTRGSSRPTRSGTSSPRTRSWPTRSSACASSSRSTGPTSRAATPRAG